MGWIQEKRYVIKLRSISDWHRAYPQITHAQRVSNSRMLLANYNLTKPKKENIRYVQCKKALYDFGIAEVITPGGNIVRAYSIERTLCDILRPHSRMDIQIVTEAFKRYAARLNKNIPALSEYAKILKVQTRLRSYLEVLL